MRKVMGSLALLFALAAFADVPKGTIEGTVTLEHAPLPGVTATIAGARVVTDEKGHYRLANLPYGKYDLTLELSGFRTERKSVAVDERPLHVSTEMQFLEPTETLTVGCSLAPRCAEDTEPATAMDLPSCRDYAMNSSLIEGVERGDASAIELLRRRLRSTVSLEERIRLSAPLLGRTSDDDAIWKEVVGHVENLIVFSDDEEHRKRDAYCAEHGWDPEQYLSVTWSAFEAIAKDARANALFRRALASNDISLVETATVALAEQHDESALPLIEKALQRTKASAMALVYYQSEAADQVAMRLLPEESDRDAYRESRSNQP